MQALAEMSVLYPVNGAFTMYICRFVDPSLGFAASWEYAISWLTVLPFEISAACNIVRYTKIVRTRACVLRHISIDPLLGGISGHQQRRLDCPSAPLAGCHPVLWC